MTLRNQLENEVNLIHDYKLRDFVNFVLTRVPDYFYQMPASTTGKYHPEYTLGEGGLLRHTKAAVKIAEDLLSLELYERVAAHHDEVIAALILHDSVKKGMDGKKFSTLDHPLQASMLLKESACKYEYEDCEKVKTICSYIESHMGQWNKDWKTKQEILPKPKTVEQKFVHLCDYLASRRYLTVDLDM